jgi:hypothetical protein
MHADCDGAAGVIRNAMGAVCIPFAYARGMESGVHHDPAVDLDELTKRYCQSLIAELEVLTFRGISRSGAISLRLEDIYVELKAVAQVSDIMDTYGADERRLLAEARERGDDSDDLRMHLDTLRLERWRTQARAERSALERRSIESAVADPRQTGLVILGDPGSGKSTLLRHLALRAARLHLEDAARDRQAPAALATVTGQPRLPILVPLAAYDGFLRRHEHKHVSLREYLPIYFEKVRNFPGLGPLFTAALEQGRALVLLDGLDEVLDESTRQHVVGQVRTLMQQEARHGNRFVVTSRVMGYHAAPLPSVLPHVTVLDFGIEEIEAFTRKWCEACEIGLAGQRTEVALQRAAHEAKALLDEVRAHPYVLALAANPLLLTMLALLRRQDYKLPEQRIELYHRYVETMLDNSWENARSDGARIEGPARLDLHLAVEYLMELSLWLHQNRPNGTARRQELIDALVDIGLRLDGAEPAAASSKDRREAMSRAERLLREMRHFAGLLGERGQDVYGFLHLTFQEYFVARALARKDAEARWQAIAPHLHQPRWRESILLCAGQLGIVDGRRNEVNDLVRRILRAQSPHEALLRRDLFLASAVAADNVGIDRRLLDELADRLIRLQDSRVRAVRSEALRGLAQLARLKHEPSLSWLEARIALQERPGETVRAIRGVLGADSCARLRRAIHGWFTEDADGSVKIDEEGGANRRGNMRTAANAESWREVVGALGPLVASDELLRQRLLDIAADAQEDCRVRGAAVGALGSLAASDEQVSRLLLDMAADTYADDTLWQAVVEVLGPLAASDEEARRLVLNTAADARENPWRRQAAVEALGPLAANDEQARRLLLDMTANAQEAKWLRQAAVGALGPLAARDAEVRRLLLDMARNALEPARRSARSALASLVQAFPECRRFAVETLDDQTWDVGWHMVAALQPLVERDEYIRQQVIMRTADVRLEMRQAATAALWPFAARDEQVRRLFLDMAADPREHRSVRGRAMVALEPLAARDEQVRRLLLDMAADTDEDETVRGGAMIKLGQLAASDDEIRRLLLGMTADTAENKPVRRTAVEALRHLTASDEEVRRLLLDMAADTDEDETVRQAAVEALGPLAASNEEVRRLLLDMVADPGESRWLDAVAMLGSLAGSDQQVRQRLLGMAADKRERAFWRREVVEALEPLASDEEIRRLLLDLAGDANEEETVRQAAVEALGPLVAKDEEVQRLFLDMAADADEDEALWRAAVEALGPLAAKAEKVRRLLVDKLGDAEWPVRRVAVHALIPLVAEHRDVRLRLFPWLGAVSEYDKDGATRTRGLLANAYAPLLPADDELRARVIGMLRSPAWPTRQGAAWALLGMPGGPPHEVLPILRGLLDDHRGEKSLSERMLLARSLVNDRDPEISRRAISVSMEALGYATQPWYDFPHTGPSIRAMAVEALAGLDPAYRNDVAFEHLARVLVDNGDERVGDAVYRALLRLAVVPEAPEHAEEEAKPPMELRQQSAHASPVLGPPMRSLPSSTLLHLSDLHFGTQEDASTWFNQLAEDLRELDCSRLDAVILSGDVANYSTEAEYGAALHFLGELSREFHVGAQRIVIVPGNHDLSWPLARKSYDFHWRADYRGPLESGRFIEKDDDGLLVRDESRYQERFRPFANFYHQLRGEPYPLAYAEQGILYHLPEQGMLILGLNSAWEIDHHYRDRASVHPDAIGRALSRIRQTPAYAECPLKLAVWHHPIASASEDRIKDAGFLEQLAKAGFRLALHGHIHKAKADLFRYDAVPAGGRRIEIVSAGTFGAPVREWVPGHPLQYNLLCFAGGTLTVKTRRRSEPNGAWEPDARWLQGKDKDPLPRYTIELFPPE